MYSTRMKATVIALVLCVFAVTFALEAQQSFMPSTMTSTGLGADSPRGEP